MKFLSVLSLSLLLWAGAARADHPVASVLSGNWRSEHGEYFFHDVEKHGSMDTFHFTRKTELLPGTGKVTCIGAGVYNRATGLVHTTDNCPWQNGDYVSHSSYVLRLQGSHPHLIGVRAEQPVANNVHGIGFSGHPHEHDERISKLVQ